MTPPYLGEALDGGMALDRRKFVKNVSAAALAVYVLPRNAQGATDLPSKGEELADNLIVRSTPGLLSHVHDLLIPYVFLRAPPRQGVKITTTKALFHTHEMALSQRQLMAVAQGGTVTARSSSHLFVIALANGQGHS